MGLSRSADNLHNHHRWMISLLLVLVMSTSAFGLNTDGVLLLSFKYSVLSDPLMVLQSWNYGDQNPCSWNGVRCSEFQNPDTSPSDVNRVVSLILPNNQLLGSISADLGMIEHLQQLDLSNNFLNGSLPASIFNASELKLLSLSNNELSGRLPESVDGLKSLESLNLSDNALSGPVPQNVVSLENLTVLSLSKNYLFGVVPNGFQKLEVLDLSSNLMNSSLPSNFRGDNLKYLNLSYNRLSGEIPLDFASLIPDNATVDISFNNLTGEVPESLTQQANSLNGNPDLCGKAVKIPCKILSTPSIPPNVSTNSTPPAIAAIPKNFDSSPGSPAREKNGLRPGAIIGIVVGDLAGIGVLFLVFLYVYRLKKKKRVNSAGITEKKEDQKEKISEERSLSMNSSQRNTCFCLGNKGVNDDEESSSSEISDSDSGNDENEQVSKMGSDQNRKQQEENQKKNGSLITVDGETELELETLLKASAYILGTTGTSIVYKAVLEDGTTLAVRRIGETGVERFRDFENQVRGIAKLRHPNLVRIRAFYWGADEKLVIYDHVPNGNLSNITYKRGGSSPYHLPWEVRLKIARGVARGLAYLHEKKHVHGNLKPTNILLGPDMDPKISDFGLGKLMWGDCSSKAGGSARIFGSKRLMMLREGQDYPIGASPSPSPSTSSMGGASPYHAPESLKNLKPNPKWDVYSFGIILLELLSGKIFSDTELAQWNTGFVLEERNRVLRMADMAIRADVEGKEDLLMSCFKLGFNCASLVLTKRPSMKEVQQVLDKIPSPSAASSSHQYYDH
ncbi:hypothetical protein C5167_013774 [Papaver somniferum]|uniref:Protein kinase domain-containing protein n=1 Tax=Papaver somniferum TaxID=3469 RepID=A0A4Y7J4E2_PAPSO|nr:probable LRR receptor-like serine/threonine-protein kinase At4g37250 [Papaver somniferum]RZC54922.1 hypothetical protein C5167_013774 [Papaver somniferum]